MDANQNRREFKFLLPTSKGERFQDFVAAHIPLDSRSKGGYPVVSEYFDTADRHSYWQKIWGAKNRRRVRTRIYGRSDGSIPPAGFIEIKHKLNNIGVKRRVAVPIDELSQLSDGKLPPSFFESNHSQSDRHVIEEIKDLVVIDGARPVVQLRYDRMAYDSGPDGSIRITFDTHVCCRFNFKPLIPNDQDFILPVLEDDCMIVEVKTVGNVPIWMREASGKFALRAVSMSKYCRSLERFDHIVARHPLAR